MPFRPKGSRNFHYDFQIKGRRFHGSCGTEDFEEAKAIEAEARVRAKNDPIARGIYTVSEALGTYITDVSAHQSSHRTTVSQGKGILSAIDPKRRLDQLSNADIMHLITRRRAVVANGTVNREIDLLGRACRHMAKIYGAALSADLDFSSVKLKEPKEITRELTWEEQERLFKHLRTDLHPFVKFALMTGARLETICELRWPDVDFLVVKCGNCGKEYRVGTHVLHERFEPYEFVKNIKRMLVCKKCGASISMSAHIERAYFRQSDRPAEQQEPHPWVCKTEPG